MSRTECETSGKYSPVTDSEKQSAISAYPSISPEIEAQLIESARTNTIKHNSFRAFYCLIPGDDQETNRTRREKIWKEAAECRYDEEGTLGYSGDHSHELLVAAMWLHLLPSRPDEVVKNGSEKSILPTINCRTFDESRQALNSRWQAAITNHERDRNSLRPERSREFFCPVR